ncbi:MAG: hypothetical protein ABI175_10040 [Polyangiales bacterium]
MRARLIAPVLVSAGLTLAMGGCSSCKKKPPVEDEVKKEKNTKKSDVPEEPLPKDLAFEAVLRDPEAVAKRAADGAGFAKEVGASPYQTLIDNLPDEKMKKAARALDPHGAISIVITGKFENLVDEHKWKPENITVVSAAHLKDATLAEAAMVIITKAKDDIKSHPAKAFEGTIYEIEKNFALAINGDLVLVGDGAEALESAGKYASYLARKGDKQDHDLYVRIPTTELSSKARVAGAEAWAKGKKDVPPAIAAELDLLIPPSLDALADAGDASAYFDVKGDDLVMEQKMSAKGSLSKWFAKYPSGDSSALLAMPLAESAVLYRFPGGLGPLTYSIVDETLKKSSLDAADNADIAKFARILGDGLGHEVVYSSNSAGLFTALGSGGGKGTAEYFGRVELTDPAGVKSALVRFRELTEKNMKGKYDPKLTTSPYKKFGAEGETITITSPSYGGGPSTMHDSTLVWAIRGSYGYVDLCVYCAPKLDSDALDPASKATMGNDPTAKAKIGTFPTSGVIEAAYGDIGTYIRTMLTFFGTPPTKAIPPVWAWATVSDSGLAARELIPLAAIGDITRAYFLRRYPSSYPSPLGTTMPMGTTMPPP